jgi:glycosyltransferase involved in cell wall biosynthesis
MVFAAREDFGMATVEAQACSCPVIALGAGGSAETVEDGVNGILFAHQTVDDVIQAIRRFETLSWTAEKVRYQTGMYSREIFKDKIRRFIEGKIREKYPHLRPEIQFT